MKHEQKCAVLMSIRPRFAELILSGSKTVELRRSSLRVSRGDKVVVYVSSPSSSVVGAFDVEEVAVGAPSGMWTRVRGRCGITRAEFDSYYQAATRAVAIFLCNPRSLRRPIPLSELRRRMVGFHPPQSFCYLPAAMMQTLSLRTV
jgi:predicted transcriptional regulator